MKLKKLMSIVLTLVMVLALIPANFASYAQEQSPFDELVNIMDQKISGLFTKDGEIDLKSLTAMISLYDYLTEDGIEKYINEEFVKLDKETQAKLNDNGFTQQFIIDSVKEIISKDDLNKLKNIVESKDKTALKEYVKTKYNNVHKLIEKTTFYKNHQQYENIDIAEQKFAVSLLKKLYDGQKLVTRISSDENANIQILFEDKYIDDVNNEIKNEYDGRQFTANEIKVIKDVKNVAVKAFENKINSTNTQKDNIELIATKLDIWKTPATKPDNGGGSGGAGGGGGGSSSEDNSDISIPKDSIEMKTDGDKTIASVKTEDLEKLVKKALNEKEVTINIDLSKVDKDVEISLPIKSLKELKGKDVKVVINTKSVEVNIPLENLDLNNDSDMKLEVKQVKADEVKESMDNSVTKVLKVVDMNLFQGDTNIGKSFAKKVRVGINISDLDINKDKSVVVRINNNNTEIVGGKIENNKIYANLEHFSKYAVVERNVSFEDCKDHWAKQNIESMSAKGIINGYEDGSFKPSNNITRAEFAKLLVNELELDIVNTKSEFKDMQGHWANDYVNTAYKAGLITGYDGNFNPNDNITRAQMAAMIGRAIDTDKASDVSNFNDSLNIPTWARKDLSKAVAEGLIKGDNGMFRSDDNTTRAEATTVIYRMYNK
ncbi:S-layer homology domain-containing protein [Tepidibacter mesophilus]|uniref:S-layer homology domain-containing protein n=1 Tax=Tepidibacter mesophilus TaxID=655607 RepID=UPI000C082C26|nr:S-layer homology domain-containing protein [Tepidibacter mesophilus]